MHKYRILVLPLALLVAIALTGVVIAAIPTNSTVTFETGACTPADGCSEEGLNISAPSYTGSCGAGSLKVDILDVDSSGERELPLFGIGVDPVIFDMGGLSSSW